MKRIYPLLLCVLLGAGCIAIDARPRKQDQRPNPSSDSSPTELFPQVESIVYENHQYQATIFKLNNKTTQWELSYSQQPKRLEDWADELDADLVVNGGFFTESYAPTGLFRVDNQTITDSAYTSSTVGSVQLQNGVMTLSDTTKLPGVGDLFQSYPLLIRPDGKTAVEVDTEKIARRTIVAQDGNDYSYIILFDGTPLSLYTASIILPRMLPELVWALNLDGGPSTGAIYNTNAGRKHLLPAIELPIVLSAKKVSPALPNGR